MNKLMVLAVALASAGASALVTGSYLDKRLRAEYDEELSEQLNASVEFLEERKKAKPTEEFKEKRIVRLDQDKPAVADLASEVIKKEDRIAYNKVIESEGYSPPEDYDGPEPAFNDGQKLGIFTITAEEYLSNESEMPQETLTYFADGGVLDTDGDFVVDHEKYIGAGRPPFGDKSGEDHIVYIRNTLIEREFEVVEDDANSADVLAEQLP